MQIKLLPMVLKLGMVTTSSNSMLPAKPKCTMFLLLPQMVIKSCFSIWHYVTQFYHQIPYFLHSVCCIMCNMLYYTYVRKVRWNFILFSDTTAAINCFFNVLPPMVTNYGYHHGVLPDCWCTYLQESLHNTSLVLSYLYLHYK